jgi:hypothetical protein
VGDLGLVSEHLARGGGGGEQQHDGVGGAQTALDLPRPLQSERPLAVGKDLEAAVREPGLEALQERRVRFPTQPGEKHDA